MDNLYIVDYVALNAVPYPYWTRVVPPPSANSFSYSAIKCWQKFARIFFSYLVLICHLYMALVYKPTYLESLIIS